MPLLLVLPADLEEPGEEPWIGGLPGTQYAAALELACRAAGLAPRFAHRADEASVHVALVAVELGVGLLPALACTPAPGVRFAPFPLAPRRHVSALTRRGAARRPAVAALLQALASRNHA